MVSLVACIVLALGAAVAAWRPRLGWVGVASATVALGAFASRFAIVPEDTFISMRYARHLVEGEGLVYNPGERVEGYTNFLWTLFLGLLHALRLPPLESTVAASVGLGIATILVLSLRGGRFAGPGTFPWCAAALVLLPAYWDAAGSGLETALFTTLVTVATLQHMGALREGRPVGWPAAAVLGLAVLTRPEGIFVAVLLSGASAAVRRDREFLRRQALVLGVALAVLAIHVAWRRSYYGEWLPNTFHCKVSATFAQVRRGADQWLEFLRKGNGLLLVPLAAAPWSVRRMPWLVPPLVAGAGYWAYAVAIGGDNFWRHRYLVPVLPGLLLVAELVARDVVGAVAASVPRAARAATAAAFVVCLWGSLGGSRFVERGTSLAEKFGPTREFGEWLTENTPPGGSVAVFAAGAVPYFTRRTVIDMYGLNDRHIARVPPPEGAGLRNAGHEKYDFDYVLALRPEFVLMSLEGNAPDSPLGRAMERDPTLVGRWLEHYEPYEYLRGARRVTMLRRRR